jgi:type IV pilus assembly protein PilE
MTKRTRGFTLLELMIVVAVVAILASVAISQYNKQIRKSRRAEAKQVITDLALRQEKWRSNHTTYVGTNSTIPEKTALGVITPASNSVTKEYYTIAIIGNASATTFTIRATPRAGTDQTKDVCTPYLELQSVSGVVTKTPATNSCW